MAEAQEQRDRLLSRTEIVHAAHREAERLVDEAKERGAKVRMQAEDYVDQKLAAFEILLNKTLATVGRGREQLRGDNKGQVPQIEGPIRTVAAGAAAPYDARRKERRPSSRRAPRRTLGLRENRSFGSSRTVRGRRTRYPSSRIPRISHERGVLSGASACGNRFRSPRSRRPGEYSTSGSLPWRMEVAMAHLGRARSGEAPDRRVVEGVLSPARSGAASRVRPPLEELLAPSSRGASCTRARNEAEADAYRVTGTRSIERCSGR